MPFKDLIVLEDYRIARYSNKTQLRSARIPGVKSKHRPANNLSLVESPGCSNREGNVGRLGVQHDVPVYPGFQWFRGLGAHSRHHRVSSGRYNRVNIYQEYSWVVRKTNKYFGWLKVKSPSASILYNLNDKITNIWSTWTWVECTRPFSPKLQPAWTDPQQTWEVDRR